MNGRGNDRRSLVMLVSSMLIFGTIGVFRRFIPVPSAFLAFSRGLLGGLCILLFLRLKKRKTEGKLPRRTLLGLIVSGALIGINWILLFEAYNHTTVAVATLCYYMQPTIVMLLSPLVFREKLTAKKAACAAVAILGMVFVSGVVGGSGTQGSSFRGVLLGLGAAVFYSAVVIMNNMIAGVDPWRKTYIQLLSAGLVMVPYLLLTGGIDPASFTPLTVVLLLVVGIVLLQEPLSLLNIVGAVMIIGSAVVSELEMPGS